MMRYGLVGHYVFAVFSFLAISFLAWYFFSRCCERKSNRLNRIFITLVVLFALCIGYDTLQFATGVYDSRIGEWLSLLGAAWLFGCVFATVLLMVFAIIWAVAKVFRCRIGLRLRNTFLVIALVLYALSLLGMYNGYSRIVVNQQKFYSDKIQNNKKFRIAYFSDLHLGNVYNIATLERTLAMIAAQKPDVLFIGGDIFDDEREIVPAINKINQFAEEFALPIYFVMGNHEYYCNAPKIVEQLALSKVKLLNNSSAKIAPDENIYVVGVDYPRYEGGMRFDKKQAELNLATAFRDVPAPSLKLLLAHSPEYVEVLNGRKLADLSISGHTHGGQVELGRLNMFQGKFQYLRGRYELPNITTIVSVGTGGWLPFRYNCPAEINIIDIEAK
ncbi:MAG: metallophosphoesterase [Bacillota bacterium]